MFQVNPTVPGKETRQESLSRGHPLQRHCCPLSSRVLYSMEWTSKSLGVAGVCYQERSLEEFCCLIIRHRLITALPNVGGGRLTGSIRLLDANLRNVAQPQGGS